TTARVRRRAECPYIIVRCIADADELVILARAGGAGDCPSLSVVVLRKRKSVSARRTPANDPHVALHPGDVVVGDGRACWGQANRDIRRHCPSRAIPMF